MLEWFYQTCPYCGGEDRPSALPRDKSKHARADGFYGPVICHNCLGAREGRDLWPRCEECGRLNVPTDLHHIDGRRNSSRTKRVCLNCHKRTHYFNQGKKRTNAKAFEPFNHRLYIKRAGTV